VEADSRQALGLRVVVAGDGVGGEHVSGVRVGVAEEVGERDGRERVRVRLVGGVELDHGDVVVVESESVGVGGR